MIDPRVPVPNKNRLIVFGLLMAVSLPLMPLPAPAFAASAAETGDSLRYIFIHQGKDGSSSMNASMEDLERARSLRGGDEALLYVRHKGAAYVIRDAETLSRAEAIFRPQAIVGAKQGELGRKQGELGRRQGELGRKQGELGRQQAEAPPRRAAELGRQQGELGKLQGELGRMQGELGRQQGELGKEQARLARVANDQLRALLADALQHGVAQRVN